MIIKNYLIGNVNILYSKVDKVSILNIIYIVYGKENIFFAYMLVTGQ